MAGLAFLDSTALWLACKPPGKPEAASFRAWLVGMETAQVTVIIPEIIDYEVRRELVRAGATAGLARLDRLLGRFALLQLDRDTMLMAADLWAQVRRAGLTMAADDALDEDAILAAQDRTAVGKGDTATVATANVNQDFSPQRSGLGRQRGLPARSSGRGGPS